MKKLFKISAIFILCLFLVGCGNAQVSMAKNLDSNLQKLSSTVNSIQDLNTNDIIISSVMPETESAQNSTTQNIVSRDEILRNSRKQYANELSITPIRNDVTPTVQQNRQKRYSTRYQNSNRTFKRTALDTHITGLEDLYSISSDVICANDDICSLKAQILENCGMLSTLCGQIKKNKITLTTEQINAINELISTLNQSCNRLNLSKNEINIEANNIKNSIKTYYTNMSTMSSKYVKLLNCMDTRISNFKNILSLLSQVQCLITGNCTDPTNCYDGNCDYKTENEDGNIKRPTENETSYDKTSTKNPNSQYFTNRRVKNDNTTTQDNETDYRTPSKNNKFSSRKQSPYEEYYTNSQNKNIVNEQRENQNSRNTYEWNKNRNDVTNNKENDFNQSDVSTKRNNTTIRNIRRDNEGFAPNYNRQNPNVYSTRTNTDLNTPRNPFETKFAESNIETNRDKSQDKSNIIEEKTTTTDEKKETFTKPSTLEKKFITRNPYQRQTINQSM